MDFTKDKQGNYNSRITKIAEILPTTLKLNEFGIVPSIEVNLFNNSYKNFAYYISIHQGLMDKIYDAFKLKENDSYSEEVRKDADKRDNAMKIAMCSVSARLYNAFHELEKDETDDFEILLNNFIYGAGCCV